MYHKSRALWDLLHKGRVERQIQQEAGSIVLDRPSVLKIKLWKLYKCYRSLPYACDLSHDPMLALPPWCRHVHVQCTVLSWQARHHGKNKAHQSYCNKDEHLGSWPVYVRRCGPADWLVSEQRPPSHKQDLSCIESTNEHANPQWYHWQVCNNSVKHKFLD